MKIKVNKKDKIIQNKTTITVSELFKIMKFSFPMIIVKINGTLVKKENFNSELIRDGDDVSAFHLISGG